MPMSRCSRNALKWIRKCMRNVFGQVGQCECDDGGWGYCGRDGRLTRSARQIKYSPANHPVWRRSNTSCFCKADVQSDPELGSDGSRCCRDARCTTSVGITLVSLSVTLWWLSVGFLFLSLASRADARFWCFRFIQSRRARRSVLLRGFIAAASSSL